MNLQPITFPENHDTVCRLLEKLRRGHVLDVPCGHGALSLRLKKMGFELSCCDIDPGLFELHDVELRVANLNRDRLPYEDETFDYIVCVNGLHRLFNTDNAISEFARCLKKDGKMLLSFPNYATLARRIHFLFTGSIGRGINAPSFTQVTESPEAHFRQALLFPQVKFALERHGLTEIRLHRASLPRWSAVLFPLGALIKVAGLLAPNSWAHAYCLRESCSHKILFGSHHLYVEAAFPD